MDPDDPAGLRRHGAHPLSAHREAGGKSCPLCGGGSGQGSCVWASLLYPPSGMAAPAGSPESLERSSRGARVCVASLWPSCRAVLTETALGCRCPRAAPKELSSIQRLVSCFSQDATGCRSSGSRSRRPGRPSRPLCALPLEGCLPKSEVRCWELDLRLGFLYPSVLPRAPQCVLRFRVDPGTSPA